jgi:1-acyl-sn-glycerol-3-phosphate acyltransferase
MPRVLVIESRDEVAEAIVAALSSSDAVKFCEQANPRKDRLKTILTRIEGARIDTAIYSPAISRQHSLSPDLAEAKAFISHCAALQVRRFILLSSAMVYGASPHNQGLIPETRKPICLTRSALARAWLNLESLAAESLEGSELTILRSAFVPTADGIDYLSRLLRGPLAIVLAGHDPSLQLLSPDDLASAVRCAVEKDRAGIYNVAPAGVIPLRAALNLTGAQRLPLPRTLQRLLHRSDELDLIRYSWTISNKKIANKLGCTPKYGSNQALARFDSGRLKSDFEQPKQPLNFDDFGMDRNYIDAYGRTMFKFLAQRYWRVEYKGISHIPKQGGAVLTGIHRGFMPWDAVMTLYLIANQTGRYVRFLIHPGLIKFPFLFNFHTKLGGVVACQDNADYVLERDELLGIYPEGIRGAFSLYRESYQLKRFRDDYVKVALRHRAPIVPFLTVGSAEALPILARLNWRWWVRRTEWPCFPITPTWPLLPIPLPSKWHTQFLAPIHLSDRYPPEAADDPTVVREISGTVRLRLSQAIEEMLRRRKSIWFGSIFEDDTTPEFL